MAEPSAHNKRVWACHTHAKHSCEIEICNQSGALLVLMILLVLVLLPQGGSVAHIMRYRFPNGLPEPAIATIMKEVGTML